VDGHLDHLIERFYKEVPYASNFVSGKEIDIEYYKRHTIEIILRLRLKRSIDALTIHYFTKTNPKLAKLWSEYTADEMLHDTLFAKDLAALGVSHDEIYSSQPLFSTKLLQGYFYYGLEHEGRPLASLSSSYFIEYTSQRTQSEWLDTVEKTCNARSVTNSVVGARAHVTHDANDNHSDFVFDVLCSQVNSKEDEEKVIEHISNIYSLFAAFFTELYHKQIKPANGSVIPINSKTENYNHDYNIKCC